MKTGYLRLAAAVLLTSAGMFAAGGAQAQNRHLSADGQPCIHFEGITYDPASQFYSANWSNSCNYAIRVHYTYFKPNGREEVNDSRTVPAYGNVSALMVTQDRLEDWYEIF